MIDSGMRVNLYVTSSSSYYIIIIDIIIIIIIIIIIHCSHNLSSHWLRAHS